MAKPCLQQVKKTTTKKKRSIFLLKKARSCVNIWQSWKTALCSQPFTGTLLAFAPGGKPAGILNVFWWQSETLRRAATFELLISAVGVRSHLCVLLKLRQAAGCAKREIRSLAETVELESQLPPPEHCRRGSISRPTCKLNANWPAWRISNRVAVSLCALWKMHVLRLCELNLRLWEVVQVGVVTCKFWKLLCRSWVLRQTAVINSPRRESGGQTFRLVDHSGLTEGPQMDPVFLGT